MLIGPFTDGSTATDSGVSLRMAMNTTSGVALVSTSENRRSGRGPAAAVTAARACCAGSGAVAAGGAGRDVAAGGRAGGGGSKAPRSSDISGVSATG